MNIKIRNKPVDWEEIYATKTKPIWKLSPHSYTKQATKINNGSRALDIGCGEGHDALYLAQHGYELWAIDVSKDAISVLQQQAHDMDVSISTKVEDATKLHINKAYDVVVSYGFLHFVGKNQYIEYIEKLKSQTNLGGVHAFYTFGDIGNFHDIGKHKYWFPCRDSFKGLYKDWIIHSVDERTVKLFVKGDCGEDLYNSLIKILVQKTEST